MNKLIYKPLNYQNLLIRCVEGIHDKSLAGIIYSNINDFKEKSEEYRSLATQQQLETISKDLRLGLTEKQMLFLYSKLRDSPHARKYYDYLLGMSSICPSCGVQISHSLDHYLAKTHYPMYAIEPYNLLPCCSDCNSIKGELEQVKGKQTLHPYFDKHSNERTLKARVNQETLGIEFYLEHPPDLTASEFSKLEFHFDKLQLNKMYSVLASKEIHSQLFEVRKLFNQGEKEAVKRNFEDIYTTNCEAEVNSWKTALYDALKEDDWFCSEGIFKFEYIETSHTEDLSLEEEIEIPLL